MSVSSSGAAESFYSLNDVHNQKYPAQMIYHCYLNFVILTFMFHFAGTAEKWYNSLSSCYPYRIKSISTPISHNNIIQSKELIIVCSYSAIFHSIIEHTWNVKNKTLTGSCSVQRRCYRYRNATQLAQRGWCWLGERQQQPKQRRKQ